MRFQHIIFALRIVHSHIDQMERISPFFFREWEGGTCKEGMGRGGVVLKNCHSITPKCFQTYLTLTLHRPYIVPQLDFHSSWNTPYLASVSSLFSLLQCLSFLLCLLKPAHPAKSMSWVTPLSWGSLNLSFLNHREKNSDWDNHIYLAESFKWWLTLPSVIKGKKKINMFFSHC